MLRALTENSKIGFVWYRFYHYRPNRTGVTGTGYITSYRGLFDGNFYPFDSIMLRALTENSKIGFVWYRFYHYTGTGTGDTCMGYLATDKGFFEGYSISFQSLRLGALTENSKIGFVWYRFY